MVKNKDFNSKVRLNRAGQQVVRASGLSAAEEKALASSPFLYARLLANIKGEFEQQDSVGFWSSLNRASKRAIPAMGLAAALSLALFVYVNGNKSQSQPFSVDAYLGAREPGLNNILFAERRPLTADEVLTSIVSRDEREAAR